MTVLLSQQLAVGMTGIVRKAFSLGHQHGAAPRAAIAERCVQRHAQGVIRKRDGGVVDESGAEKVAGFVVGDAAAIDEGCGVHQAAAERQIRLHGPAVVQFGKLDSSLAIGVQSRTGIGVGLRIRRADPVRPRCAAVFGIG